MKYKGTLCFLLGFATGGIAARLYLGKLYNEQLTAEKKELRDFYNKAVDDLATDTIVKKEQYAPIEESVVTTEQDLDLKYEQETIDYTSFSKKDLVIESNDEPIKFIKASEYGTCGYTEFHLERYYDGVVVDSESDVIITDIDDYLPKNYENYFGVEDATAACFRNDALKYDVEIIVNSQNYNQH